MQCADKRCLHLQPLLLVLLLLLLLPPMDAHEKLHLLLLLLLPMDSCCCCQWTAASQCSVLCQSSACFSPTALSTMCRAPPPLSNPVRSFARKAPSNTAELPWRIESLRCSTEEPVSIKTFALLCVNWQDVMVAAGTQTDTQTHSTRLN
jgi:hypothetical protein